MAIFNLENLEGYDDIYDPLVQESLIQAVRDGEEINKVIDTIITIDGRKRNPIQYGMWKRLKGEAASAEEWADPRTADGVPILARKSDDGKVDYRSHTPFDRTIVQNKASYFLGIPPQIGVEEGSAAMEWFNNNSFNTLMSELCQDASGMGEAFTLLYSPEGSTEAFISKEQPWHCVVLYDQDTGLPEYGLIYFSNIMENSTENTNTNSNSSSGDEIFAYWYDVQNVTKYIGQQNALVIEEQTVPHLFDGVPLIEWPNNTERVSDTEQVIGLMDIYDFTDSDFLSELGQLRLAYLLLKGMGLSDGSEGAYNTVESRLSNIDGFEGIPAMKQKTIIESIKKAGTFLTDEESADAKFIQKNLNYEAVEYAKNSLKARIFQMAGSYDPVSLTGENGSSNVTAFQIRMKLFGLENASTEVEQQFRKSFAYMVKLLSGFYSTWRGADMGHIDIQFKRNIPSNILQDLKDYRQAGGMLSQKQLMKRAPFHIDQEENLEELAEEQNSMLMMAVDDGSRTTIQE